MLTTLLLLGAFVAGLALAYFFVTATFSKHHVPQQQYNTLVNEVSALKVTLAGCINKDALAEGYVSKDWFKQCNEELSFVKNTLAQKETEVLQLTKEKEGRLTKETVEQQYVAKEMYEMVYSKWKETEHKFAAATDRELELSKEVVELRKEAETLLERHAAFKQESEAWQAQATDQFKNMAQDILKEKGADFVASNKLSIDQLLNPLKQDISQFKKTIEDTRKEDIQDLTSLKKEIEALQKLNTQLSNDAQKLAGALKSDVKVQGAWGEDRLKLILEAEGLQRYIDFNCQGAFKDNDEETVRKPDFILNLPDGKHIIIDSKVSLNAYVEYFNCTDEYKKRDCLKQLVRNINDHIDGLSAKNYHLLNGVNSPDFVCLFMHFEPALSMALNECPDILQRALNKKIVLLTPTTLVATAKMIRLIWQKENRVKNVEEIFKQCGLLYDKFVSFVDDFQNIGESLHLATANYKSAMDRLKEGKRKGDTILGRFENIKTLEARTAKSLPQQLLSELEVLDNKILTVDATGL